MTIVLDQPPGNNYKTLFPVLQISGLNGSHVKSLLIKGISVSIIGFLYLSLPNVAQSATPMLGHRRKTLKGNLKPATVGNVVLALPSLMKILC